MSGLIGFDCQLDMAHAPSVYIVLLWIIQICECYSPMSDVLLLITSIV